MQGPCLPHCYRPCGPVTVGIARVAMVYAGACVFYLLMTRRLDRPLYESLTPMQRAIKQESTKIRSRIFCMGLVASFAVICVLRPLH